MTHETRRTAVANPQAAVWDEAARRLTYRIDAIHELGVHVDRSVRNLHWTGASANRFATRAATRHDLLHQHNDTLRYLLTLVRQAAETPAAAPAANPVPS